MDFMLRYRGPLPSTGSPRDKQAIREALHPQLEALCKQEPLLEEASVAVLPQATIHGRQLQVQRPLKGMYFGVSVGPLEIVPIIHRPHELVCSLDVMFLRREKPGAIVVHGGDLDNRLKTLFDGLRMPHDVSELPKETVEGEKRRLYCLLEDDALITRVSVSTHQLLEPLASGEHPTTVELLLHVTIQSTYPMIANSGF